MIGEILEYKIDRASVIVPCPHCGNETTVIILNNGGENATLCGNCRGMIVVNYVAKIELKIGKVVYE